jgi:transposase
VQKTYSAAFKAKMVQRMAGPEARTAANLAREVGVSQTSLSKWLREAKVRRMPIDEEREQESRRPEDWSAEEKLAAVIEAGRLGEEAELGEFLRRRGIHQSQLEQWKQSALEALGSSSKSSRSSSADSRRIRELEKQLQRKDKALAETAALLVLQKKVRSIWGAGDDDTEPETDE